ncbi:hypothetical protein [Paraburkholderia sp. EG304]|uniref:hypothetical protein n=1 Tax=Paraburkholderia sp. EG304 TaxID=3237015 RepID=UPI00397D1313
MQLVRRVIVFTMLKIWFDFVRALQTAFYMSQIDSKTFMSWRPEGIQGVASIPGC